MENKKNLASVPEKSASIGADVEGIYFNSTYGIMRIDKVEHKEDEIYIHMSSTLDGISWKERSSVNLFDFKRRYIKVDHMLGKTVPQIIEELNKDVIKAIQDPSFLDIDNTVDETTTALIEVEGKKKYEDMVAVLESKKRRVEIIKELAREKLNALSTIASNLQSQLSRVMRVVDILELYLGVREEIFQLTEGIPESADHPICIRQLVLYMDEEAAIADISKDIKGMVTIDNDIDWMNVEAFDEWILESDDNLDQVLPEKKGIVAIKPSRQDRDRYGSTAYERAGHHSENAKTYLLVRNGENLYRIWINDTMGGHFFPTLAESEDIAKLFDDASHSWDKEKAEDKQMSNIRNALLMQGIIDRTDILRPYPKAINFTEASTYGEGGLIKLIRDAEITLPSGRPSFNEWKDKMNEKIERGTRIFNAGIPWEKDGYSGRYSDNYYKWFPPAPSPGIYSVDSIVIKHHWASNRGTEALKVLYNPGDTVYSRDYYKDNHTRTKRISFLFYKDDTWVLNYDLIDVKDILFYLSSRIERRNYLKLMPVLRQILVLREEEIKQENLFIDLVADEIRCSSEVVKDAVIWWKNKVIFKRPLDQDDKKAWRMIKKHILKHSAE